MVVDVLNRFLGDYVVNLDSSQLQLGIWGGKPEARLALADLAELGLVRQQPPSPLLFRRRWPGLLPFAWHGCSPPGAPACPPARVFCGGEGRRVRSCPKDEEPGQTLLLPRRAKCPLAPPRSPADGLAELLRVVFLPVLPGLVTCHALPSPVFALFGRESPLRGD